MKKFVVDFIITTIVIAILTANFVGVEAQILTKLIKCIPVFITFCLFVNFVQMLLFSFVNSESWLFKGKNLKEFKKIVSEYPEQDSSSQEIYHRATDLIIYVLFALNGLFGSAMLFFLNIIVQRTLKRLIKDAKEIFANMEEE